MNEIKDLGCLNGWGKNVPVEYAACPPAHYKTMKVKILGNCWTEYTCPVCKIRYNVDSSD